MDDKLKSDAQRVARDAGKQGATAFVKWLAKRPRIARLLVKLGMKR